MSSRPTKPAATLVRKTAAVAMMVFMMVVGGASVAHAAPGGGTAGSDDVSVQSCSGYGGGVWCRGSTNLSNGNKKCYSDYRHDTKVHGSAVSGGGKSASTRANPGIWAKSSIEVERSAACSFAAIV